MQTSRRRFLSGMLATAGAGGARVLSAQHTGHSRPATIGDASAPAPMSPVSGVVETPDLPKAAWQLENGAKAFRLRAEPVRTHFLPGREVDTWGFNGSMPGPTIEVNQGDRVRFVVENGLPELFSMHWHGLEVPPEMDGVPGLLQDPIPPGGTFTYEFTLHQHGTFFYHSHMPMQELMGLVGLFVVHPAEPYDPPVDRDFGLVWQGWALLPHNTVPNTMAMEFNWLTINGRSGPAATPLLVKHGERVRIRNVNLSMDHHPIHLHGNTFYTVGTEAGRVPRTAWQPGNTVIVGVAQARDIEFEARTVGDWMLHCHLPHHMMNQMMSMVGPITHGTPAVPAGLDMTAGMGIVEQGHALSDSLGPSLGRTLGVPHDQPVMNGRLLGPPANDGQVDAASMGQHAGHDMAAPPGARSVPGYPQDMWMVMDERVAKPETHGLRPSWTGGMMGMMTMVRVLEPERYDEIQALKQQAREEGRA